MLTGLDSTKLYRIDIFASRFNPSQTSTFSTGAASVTISTNNNTASVATFDNLTPVTGGKIVVTVTHGQYYDYINGFTLTEKTVVTPADIIPSADSSILTAFGPDSSLTGNAALAVYPNPIKGGTFELSVNNTYTGMIKVQIVNSGGVLVKEFVIPKNSQLLQTPLSIEELRPGNYFLAAWLGKWRRTVKIVKL
jgi:hypothetical protein